MRLIDYMRAAEKTGQYNVWSEAEPLLDDFFQCLNDPDLSVIDVTNVADYIGADIDRFNKPVQEVISCALPPFSSCWMECRTRGIEYMSLWEQLGAFMNTYDLRSRSLVDKHNLAGAIGIPAERRENLNNVAWIVRGDFSGLRKDGSLECLWGVAYFLLDVGGMVLRPMLGGHRVDRGFLDTHEHERLSYITVEIMGLFGMASSFMSCKNVQLIENQPPRHERRQREREGKMPATKYYTLEIEPMKKILRTEGKSEEVGLKKALHICRGHFAHYTPDKPLFGKVSGRFWIPAHVRGSKEAGEIKKDYKIKTPKEEP